MEAPELDSGIEMERRALRNVRSLHEKLAREDAIERRGERRFTRYAVVIVLLAVAGLGVATLLREPAASDVELAGCAMEAQFNAAWARRTELRARVPKPPESLIDELVEGARRSARPWALAQCRLGMGP